MNDEEDLANQPPVTSRSEIEHGLFNLVITLARLYEGEGLTSEQARELTASYLERLIAGLRARPEEQGEQIR